MSMMMMRAEERHEITRLTLLAACEVHSFPGIRGQGGSRHFDEREGASEGPSMLAVPAFTATV